MNAAPYAQLTLDGMDAPTAKIIAINQVEANADPAWLKAAYAAVQHLCASQLYWNTDMVWSRLEEQGVAAPHEPRAMGAVIRQARRDRLIEPSGRYESSERVECHGRPVAMWRSL